MEKKITVLNLIDELALQANLTQAASEEFIRSFFALIEEGLVNDGIVKIKGWGTFKVSATNDRESVDVNNGERIVIKGYKKVSFAPESSLKDFINRPFSQFETAELNDGYSIDDEIVDDGKDAIGEGVMDEPLVVGAVVPEINQELPVEPDNDMSEAVEKTTIGNTDTEITEERKSTEETVPVEIEPEVAVLVSANVPDESIDTPMDNEAAVGESSKEVNATPETVEVPQTETVQEMSQQAVCEADVEGEAQPSKTPEKTEEKSYEEEPHSQNDNEEKGEHHRASWKYWLPILVLILVAACLFIYFFYGTDFLRNSPFARSEKDNLKVESINFNSQEGIIKDETVANEVNIETVDDPVEGITSEMAKGSVTQSPAIADDKNSNETTEASTSEPTVNTQKAEAKTTNDITEAEAKSTAKPSANEAVKENAAAQPSSDVPASGRVQLSENDLAKNIKDITMADTTSFAFGGVLTTHKLQAGETIIRLSQIYYGDKRLWPYIVRYNNMETPNSVQAGTAIKIPILKNK